MVHTLEEAHPHPRGPQRGRPGGHHAATGMRRPPPRCSPGPPPPLHPPSPPPMAPGHPPRGLGHRRPLPTPPPPHQEGEGQGQGESKGPQGTFRQEGTEGPQVRAGTHRDRAPEETQHGGRKPPRKGQERGPRHRGKGHHGRRQDSHPGRAYHERGDERRPTSTERRTTPGGAPPNKHRRSKQRTPYGSHQRTPTGHRKPHGGWMAHLHGEDGLHPRRKPQGTPPRGAPPRPHRQVTTPAATRATSQAPEEDEGTATATRAREGTSRGHGTKAEAPR